jgi:hypothetical protein
MTDNNDDQDRSRRLGADRGGSGMIRHKLGIWWPNDRQVG